MKAIRSASILIIFFHTSAICPAQTVGIGTSSPSANAVLDVTSTNKGILLPRLNDTTSVVNPTTGLFIFNKNTGSPNYYDGVKWHSFNAINTSAPQDSITYTITSTTGGLVVGTFNLYQLNHGGVAGVNPSMNTVSITKYFDANTVPFKKMLVIPQTNTSIEFKVYTPGTSTPYYSVKLSTWRVTEESFAVSSSVDGKMVENYTLDSNIIAFKDWINNQSFGWNAAMGQVVGY